MNRIFYAIPAIVLYAAIADAAVETFLGQSPLRWWVAGAAALYFVLCGAALSLLPEIRRRMDWATQAALSLAVLLILAGATAWMPEGLEQGLIIVGHSSSTVLAILSAVGVALAAVFFARLRFIPAAAKVLAGLLAAYGVAAFVWAAHAGTPFAALFHGGSEWTRLPFWLQGATLGGLFLVPLVLLLEILAGLRPVTHARRENLVFKVIALCTCVAICFAAVRIPAGGSSAIQAERLPPCGDAPCMPGGEANGSTASAPEAASSAQAAVDRLTQLRDAQPKQDLDAVIAAHQGSPAEQFTYVRDQIQIEAYAGAMRGPAVTATTRAGNPADKALLLAELLKSSGATVRFARASIEASDAAKLVDAVRALPVPAGAGMAGAAARIDRAVAAAPEDRRQPLRTALTKASDAAQALFAKADAQGAEIAKTLASSRVVLGNEVQLRADAMLALRDHVWVQVQNGTEWQDLDPSLPTLQPGQRLPTAREVATSDDLPGDQYVTLEVRAFATRAAKESTADQDVIDASRRVIDLQSEPLTLEILPDSNVAPKDLGSAASFHAHLHIARDDIGGDSFPVEDADQGRLLALGVAITVNRPGFAPVSYTRTVVDRRDPGGGIAPDWSDSQRVSCALTSRFNGLVVTGQVAPAYYRARQLDELIALQAARATRRQPGSSEGFAGDYPYAALRYFYRAQSLLREGARFAIDRPNIAFERSSLDCPSGKLSSRVTIDVVENGESAIAANATIAARANLARGALGEAIEMNLMGARGNGVDTPSIMAAAARAETPLVVLRPGDSAALKTLALAPMFERAIGSTLAAGQVAAATRSPILIAGSPHIAWWAVDPASGNTIGRVDDGGGQAMMEAAIQQTNATISIVNFMQFGFSVEMCGWTDANLGLNGQDYDVAACITGAVCKLAVQDAMDAGFNMFGMLSELEQSSEAFELMTSDLEYVKAVSVPDSACGE
jgi:hypothetical protein